MRPSARLFLASASPRRRELLAQAGFQFELVNGAEVDETPQPGEPPERLVARLALAKARAGREALAKTRPGLLGKETGSPVVLGADTEVVLDGRVFGKPADEATGVAMLLALSDRSHEVLSAVCVLAGTRERVAISHSRVRFRKLDAAEVRDYWATGEPRDKAGGYAIQGRGAAFVSHLEGSRSGVVGLPLEEAAELLRGFGITPTVAASGQR